MRVGIGYDIHRLTKGRKLVLGGVEVAHTHGLLGHSDGDVLDHAIVDAALGAAGLGDIGEYFSDQDPKEKDRNSVYFVQRARALLAKKGLRVTQIDSVLVAEAPKLLHWKQKIRQSLSKRWGVSLERVNVKAKTNEGLDAVGLKKAIACHAVVLLKKGK